MLTLPAALGPSVSQNTLGFQTHDSVSPRSHSRFCPALSPSHSTASAMLALPGLSMSFGFPGEEEEEEASLNEL